FYNIGGTALVVVAVSMIVVIGFLAAKEINGPPSTTPPPYITPNPEDPCEISIKDLRDLSESLVSRDVNNVANKIIVKYNSTRLLEVGSSVLTGPTIAALMPLYDNYKAHVGEDDDWNEQQTAEKDAFLDAIMDTKVMQFTELWMNDRCLLNDTDLRSVLDEAWFTGYAGSHSGGDAVDSSGFEHTFLGQLMDDRVLGFNNWIFYSHEQQAETVKYNEGDFINSTQIGEGDTNKGEIVKLNFLWQDLPTSGTTMFIGTSPELELALYTVCFRLMPGKHCPLQMKKKQFELLTMDYQNKGVISVAKPIFN
ncbi:unnamed protein product, partial [Meganyctiphanes norvegica]